MVELNDGGYREKFLPKWSLNETNKALGTTAVVLSLIAGGYIGVGMAIVAGTITYINNIKINHKQD